LKLRKLKGKELRRNRGLGKLKESGKRKRKRDKE
jgi:hypothetical protein